MLQYRLLLFGFSGCNHHDNASTLRRAELLHYIIQMLVARHYAVDAAVINYTTMLSPPIHPSIHPAKKEEKSNRGESTPVFLLIIERTLTRKLSSAFDGLLIRLMCVPKCRYGNWSSLLNRHARKRGPTPVDILDWEND